MKVNEIFYSLQGEGHYTGTAAVFLRLSGCNTRCSFCDTNHFSATEMTENEIVEAVSKYPARHIVITGGEPMMQLTASLVEKLHAAGFFIQIETNGSLPLPDGCHIDWVTCSPKDLPIKAQQIEELKVLFPFSEAAKRFLAEEADGITNRNGGKPELRLQPIDTGNNVTTNENIKATIDYILSHPQWKISLQTHKILSIQ